MTVETTRQAVNEMVDRFVAAWGERHLDLPNKDSGKTPATNVAWARWRAQHNTGRQASLAGSNGRRKWERTGNIIIQVFAPLNVGIGVAYDLAEIAVNAYEGKRTPSDVWFRDVRAVEVGNATGIEGDQSSGEWYQINVIMSFVYETYK